MIGTRPPKNLWLAVVFVLPLLTPVPIKRPLARLSGPLRDRPANPTQSSLQGQRQAVPSPVDPYEPNDAFNEATFLANDASSKYGYLWPIGDEDWFWFQVPHTGAFRIETWLDSIPAGCDYHLAIYHPAGDLIAETGSSASAGGSLSLSVSEGGRFRARIWSPLGGDAWDAYRIRTLVSPIPSADLALSMQMRTIPLPYPVTIYQFLVRNHGPDPANGIILIDTLPPGVVFGGVIGPEGWMCDLQVGRVVCRHPGPVKAGETLSPVILRLYSLTKLEQEVSNTAWVSSTVFDPEKGNNRVP